MFAQSMIRKLSVCVLSLFLTFISILITACGTDAGAVKNDSKVIHIGYQKYGTLNILKAKGTLDKQLANLGYRVEWTEFPGGPQLLEAMGAGSIDIGHTGEAPPVFAQAAGVPLVYLAHEPSSPHSEAILVPPNSSIHDIKELKGKKVALNKGSNVHYLLVRALQSAGLKYQDIQPVYLTPADARAAFQRGSVDAWVIWDPYFAAAESSVKARVLKDGQGLAANHEFYLATRSFAENHPDVIKVLFSQLNEVDVWAKDHKQDVANLLSPQLGIPVPPLVAAAERRNYGIEPMSEQVIREQQSIADTFYQLGLIPKTIRVQENVYKSADSQ
jgi:sulfonate transport system substrate-binding protein